jgi:hypothetical protein
MFGEVKIWKAIKTNSMQHSPWEADSSSACQEISHNLRNPNVRYCLPAVCVCPQPGTIQFKPPNPISLRSILSVSKWSFYFRFIQTKFSVRFSSSTYFIFYDLINSFTHGAEHSFLHYCIPLRPEYLPYDHKLQYPQPICNSFNLLKSKRNRLYIRNQSVPRCKHFPPVIRKNQSVNDA